MRASVWLYAAGVLSFLCVEVFAAAPIAQHVHASTTKNTDSVITLLPFDADGDATSVTITALPSVGSLYQLSANYISFGYEPARGTAITTVPTTLTTAAANRLVYSAPIAFSRDRFEYTVLDTVNTLTSATGYVDVTDSTGVTLQSNFLFDHDSWTVVTAASNLAAWSATSTGSLNRFIYQGEVSLVVGANNNVRWYFNAPAAYTRNNARLYGGTLSFSIGSFEGLFTAAGGLLSTPYTFISLRCSTCGATGIHLAQRNVVYTGGLTTMSFTLNELPSSGWLKDPFNDQVTVWSSPSQCEFIQVLAGLDGIRVYGDFTTGTEAVGMDSFTLTVGNTAIPTTCY